MRSLLLSTALVLGLPLPAMAERTVALIIGIDAYDHIPSLAGAVNDARDIAGALEGLGAEVTLLLDHEASRQAILSTWEELAGGLGAGDRFIITYAGHGSNEPEAIPGEEDDGRDENWLLSGFSPFGAASGERIRDNEIAELVALTPAAEVIFLSDSCHSGTVSREIAPVLGYRFFRTDGTLADDPLPPPPPRPAGDAEFEGIALYLGAVPDAEKVPEFLIADQPRGALSWAFAEGMRGAADADGDGVLSTSDIEAFVRARVRDVSQGLQRPQISMAGEITLVADGSLTLPGGGAAISAQADIDPATVEDPAPGDLLAAMDENLVEVAPSGGLESGDPDLDPGAEAAADVLSEDQFAAADGDAIEVSTPGDAESGVADLDLTGDGAEDGPDAASTPGSEPRADPQSDTTGDRLATSQGEGSDSTPEAVDAVVSPESRLEPDPPAALQRPFADLPPVSLSVIGTAMFELPQGARLLPPGSPAELVLYPEAGELRGMTGDLFAKVGSPGSAGFAASLQQAIDSARVIAALRTGAGSVGPQIAFAEGDGTYAAGDRVTVGVVGRSTRFITLFSLAPDGLVRPLYPLQAPAIGISDPVESDPAITLDLPMQVGAPFGSDHMIAIEADSLPLELARFLDDPGGAWQPRDFWSAVGQSDRGGAALRITVYPFHSRGS